jgi:hypothetical protein
MKIGKYKITASRWPWQKGYNWHGSLSSAPLNPRNLTTGASPRFGGGWKYSIGVNIGGKTVMLNLLFGSLRITVSRGKS